MMKAVVFDKPGGKPCIYWFKYCQSGCFTPDLHSGTSRLRFDVATGPEVLHLGERPLPDLPPAHLLVRVAYTALNRADTLQRSVQKGPRVRCSTGYSLSSARPDRQINIIPMPSTG